MKHKQITILILFGLFLSCTKTEMTPQDEETIDNNEDDGSEGDEGNDNNETVFISDFPISTAESINDKYLIQWTKPQYNDSLDVKYNMYLNNQLFAENIDPDESRHFIHCELIQQNSVNNGIVEAYDQYGNIKEESFVLDNTKATNKSIVPFTNKFRYGQFMKLNNGNYMSYSFHDGDVTIGFDNMKIAYYDNELNFLQEQVINSGASFNFGGGTLTTIPYVDLISFYSAIEISDGFIFINNSHLPALQGNENIPYIFKVDFNGNLSFTKQYVTNTNYELGITDVVYLESQQKVLAYTLSYLTNSSQNFVEYSYYDLQGNLLEYQSYLLNSSITHYSTAGIKSATTEKFVGDGIVFTHKIGNDQSIRNNTHLSKVNLQGQIEWTLTIDADYNGNQPYVEDQTQIFIDSFSSELNIYGVRDKGFVDSDFITATNQNGYLEDLSPFVATISKTNGSIIEFKELFENSEDFKLFEWNTALNPIGLHHPEDYNVVPEASFEEMNDLRTDCKIVKSEDEIIFIGNDLFRNFCEGNNNTGYTVYKFDTEFNLIWSTKVTGTLISNDTSPNPTAEIVDYIITENKKVYPLGNYINNTNSKPMLGILQY